jgi:hypothetical protein
MPVPEDVLLCGAIAAAADVSPGSTSISEGATCELALKAPPCEVPLLPLLLLLLAVLFVKAAAPAADLECLSFCCCCCLPAASSLSLSLLTLLLLLLSALWKTMLVVAAGVPAAAVLLPLVRLAPLPLLLLLLFWDTATFPKDLLRGKCSSRSGTVR